MEGFPDIFSTMMLGKRVYVTPKLLSNLLGMKQRGIKIRMVGDKEYVGVPLD